MKAVIVLTALLTAVILAVLYPVFESKFGTAGAGLCSLLLVPGMAL